MSAAAPTVDAGAVVPAKKGKKKLLLIAAVVTALVLGAVAAAVFVLGKKSAAPADAADSADKHAVAKYDAKHPPIFLPLEPFVVNLADKDADRYAQIGITIELADAKFADEMKVNMPAIRNGILMILAHKDSHELLVRSGKERLARQIQREAARTMGLDVGVGDAEGEVEGAGAAHPPPATSATSATPATSATSAQLKATAAAAAREAEAQAEDGDPEAAPVKAKPAPLKARIENPIRHVHFSNFIIQ